MCGTWLAFIFSGPEFNSTTAPNWDLATHYTYLFWNISFAVHCLKSNNFVDFYCIERVCCIKKWCVYSTIIIIITEINLFELRAAAQRWCDHCSYKHYLHISSIEHKAWKNTITQPVLINSYWWIIKLLWFYYKSNEKMYVTTFFHIGTVAFRLSMQYWVASREFFLWADDTAIITLASPMGTTLESKCALTLWQINEIRPDWGVLEDNLLSSLEISTPNTHSINKCFSFT